RPVRCTTADRAPVGAKSPAPRRTQLLPLPAHRDMIRLSRLEPSQWDEAARTIHGSLRDWYARHLNRGDKFGDDWRGFRAMPEIYESLDPGCCVTACDAGDGRLLGVCFYHPRETHVAVGIVSTATEAA